MPKLLGPRLSTKTSLVLSLALSGGLWAVIFGVWDVIIAVLASLGD